MKEIQLTHGKVALVDDEDYPKLIVNKWQAWQQKGYWYAIRKIPYPNGNLHKTQMVLMHREILDPPKNLEVDHKNGNGLDNRRNNIRIVTTSQNQFNRRKPKNNTSGYKGVGLRWDKKQYEARICVQGNHIHLGHFDDLISAAHAYDAAARKYHGEFAYLNFPDIDA